jgi:hypothetical protein
MVTQYLQEVGLKTSGAGSVIVGLCVGDTRGIQIL